MDIGGESMGEALSVLIFFFAFIGKKLREYILKNNKANKNKVEENSKKLDKLYNKIIECRHNFGACRVSINQFHNGEYYYSKNSILKMSMTHETTNASTAKIMSDYQNVLASKYHKFLNLLVDNDVVVYDNLDDVDDSDDDMVLDLKLNGTYSFYASKIKDAKGKVVGYLTMSFCSKPEDIIEVEEFKEYKDLVSFILRS